jgi:hypothetical protein
LFSGRYKALVVDGSRTGYLKTVCDYVHLNPARAKLPGLARKLASYRWSSLRWYLQARRQRPAWLRVERLLGEHGIPSDTPAGRREFGRRMEQRGRTEEEPGQFKDVRRGWCLGDKAFREGLLGQMKEQMREHHYGEEREQAEAMVREGLKQLGWKEADLAARRKGDKGKLKVALRLRAETTVSVKWIAERLRMGTWTHLNHLLYWHRRGRLG